MELNFGLLLIFIISIFLITVTIKKKKENKERQNAISLTDKAINAKIEALARRRAQLMKADQYGITKTEKWDKEIRYFLETVVFSDFNKYSVQIAIDKYGLIERVETATTTFIDSHPNKRKFPENIKGHEYEHYCAEELRAAGWDARVTQGSRDQGVDIIAERSRIRLVVQCKLRSKPISNQAVQQITAGRIHEQADIGAVVSNNSFTTSAQELAATNNILLLHHRDLMQIHNLLGLEEVEENSEDTKSFELNSEKSEAQPDIGTVNLNRNLSRKIFPKINLNYTVSLGLVFFIAITIAIIAKRSVTEIANTTANGSVLAEHNQSEAEVSSNNMPNSQKPSKTNRDTGLSPLMKCYPKRRGSAFEIKFSLDRSTLLVVHKLKKGLLEVVAEYKIRDKNDIINVSWEGVDKHKSNFQVKGQIAKVKGAERAIYKDEILDTSSGRNYIMEATCR